MAHRHTRLVRTGVAVFFGQLFPAFCWQPQNAWRICGAAMCASPALNVSQDPRRCSNEEKLRFSAEDEALCLDQEACSEACRARSDCHHAQVLNAGDPLCYLKPMACENEEKWHFSPQYSALVKSQLPKGCPAKPKPMLAEPPVQQPLASSSTTVPEMEDGKLYVIHTPAPGALPEDQGPSWSLTMTLHTPPPMTLAEKVLQSESAFIPEATQGPRWSEIPASDKGRWPDDVPPASKFASPGDRWFPYLGRSCVKEGISQSRDLCIDHPNRNGFTGPAQGYKAICANVSRCMELCDATERCFAVEMSQEVDRCELKSWHCMVHENWQDSHDSNLLVVARLQGGHGRVVGAFGEFAHVPSCNDSVVSRCPVEWSYYGNPGGFHCNEKLRYQTSEAEYVSSDGACRPASAGAFPVGDCRDQCRISSQGRVRACPPNTDSRCPTEWKWKGHPGGFHCLEQLRYQSDRQAFLSSDGACRPASAGPFPSDDCTDQCRIGHESTKHNRTGLEVLLDASTIVTQAATITAKAHLDKLTSAMHFGMIDLPGDSHLSYQYSGIVTHELQAAHCTPSALYFVPFNADNVGILETSTRTFRSVDISSFARGEFKYSAGVVHNDVAYFTPYGADHVGIFDLKTERFGRLDIFGGSQACKYDGALQHGSTAYFVPSSAENIGVLDMEKQSFRTIALRAAGGKWKYRGGVLHDGKCYFAPYNADNIGVLDVQTEEFQIIDISRVTFGDMKFTDAFVQNEVVFFVPFNANGLGALHLSEKRFEVLTIPELAMENYKFWGSIQVGGLTYFVPDKADAVGVFDAATRLYTRVDIGSQISTDFKFANGIFFNGMLYFSPRDAPGIGTLQVREVHGDLCKGKLSPSKAQPPKGVAWEDQTVTDTTTTTTTTPSTTTTTTSASGQHRHGAHPHHGAEALGHGTEQHGASTVSGNATSPALQYSEPRPSWATEGRLHPVAGVLIAVASIALVLLPAELSREKWDGKINDGSLSFLRSVVVATMCSVGFFVLRSLFAGGAVPFWVQMGPALVFFIVLWLIFQASLLLMPYDRRTARLDLVELFGCCTSFAGVDAGGALLRCFTATCGQAVAALIFYQVLLLALDGLIGLWARSNRVPRADHRSTLLAPPAVLFVEVLTFALLGEFGQETLLNRQGAVQDGTAPGEAPPAFGLVLALYSLSCIMFAVALLLEHYKVDGQQVASLSAFWAAIRASQWLAKLMGLPDQGSLLLLCVLLTALLAQLLSVELQPDCRSASTSAHTPHSSSLPKPLGQALGLLWASAIVQSTRVLVLVAVPQRIITAEVHFMAVWLLLSLLVTAAMFYIKARAARPGYNSVSPASPLRRQNATDLPSYERQGAVDLPPLYMRQGASDLSDASPSRFWLLNPFSWFAHGPAATPKSSGASHAEASRNTNQDDASDAKFEDAQASETNSNRVDDPGGAS